MPTLNTGNPFSSATALSSLRMMAFLEKKGKFIAREEGFTTAENKICR
ncbi:DUF2492 family protein, partial [Klebsiella variicola]